MLKIKNINKTFITTKALDNVKLDINRGEIRGLAGENGSGKSTLASIIAGILFPDCGQMLKDGKKYSPKNMIEANNSKVGIIVQELGTIEDLSVGMNIFLGKEDSFTKFGFLNKKKLNNSASILLKKYGLENIKPEFYINELRLEERKLVELVKALYFDPDLLIIDETSSTLSQFGRGILYKVIQKLKKDGKSVIFITHDLAEIITYTDNITIMKDGKIIDTINSMKVDEGDIKKLMVGRKLKNKYYREDFDTIFAKEIILSIKNLNLKNVLKNITFNLHRGEILGIGGLTNCGMHDLGEIIFGLKKKASGYVILNKKNNYINNIYDALNNGIIYVPKDRDKEGLMTMSSIKDNIILPSLNSIQKKGFISPLLERKIALSGARELDLKMDSIDQLCMYLSGGNKQKVVLSKWLIKDPEILVVDCPTRGIDVNVKSSIYSLMEKLRLQGKSIIMISEELQELIGMSDRIIILKNGEISKIFNRNKNLAEEEIIQYMI